jgi:serine protease Do
LRSLSEELEMAQADRTAEAVQQVAETAASGVVRIGRGWGRGAGFVLEPGFVVTNAHNIRGEQVTVALADGSIGTGTLAGLDADGDMAVVAVDTGDASPLAWAEEEAVLGQEVVALTHDAAAGVRVTAGRVSARGAAFRSPRGRLVRDAIEHTAPLARGSSGGPVLDADGRLLGVNTHRRGDGFYLAVPATAALRERLAILAGGRSVERPRLGVAIAPAEAAARLREAVGLPEREGLLVRGVEEGGAADRAGLGRGDLLVAADGEPLRTSDDLFGVLDALAPEAVLRLTLVRGTEEQDVEVAFLDEDAG